MIDKFLVENPNVRAEITLSDAVSDVIGMGLDFAIRDTSDVDPTLTMRPLIPNDRVVVAAPDYLNRHGTPHTPADLVRHACLLLNVGGQTIRHWRFVMDGTEQRLALDGARITNDAGLLADWCRAGHGIALKSRVNVEDSIKEGALVPILSEFLPAGGHFKVVYSANRALPRRVAALITRIETELSVRLSGRPDLVDPVKSAAPANLART